MVGVVFIGFAVICLSLVSCSEDFEIVNNYIVLPQCPYRLDFNTTREHDTLYLDGLFSSHDGRFQSQIILKNVTYIITFTCLNGKGVFWRKTFNPKDYNFNMTSPNPVSNLNSDCIKVDYNILFAVMSTMIILCYYAMCVRYPNIRMNGIRPSYTDAHQETDLTESDRGREDRVDINCSLVEYGEQVLNDNARNVGYLHTGSRVSLSSTVEDLKEPAKKNGSRPLDLSESTTSDNLI